VVVRLNWPLAQSLPSRRRRQHEIQNIPTHVRIVREKQISDAPKVAVLLLALTLPAVAQKPTIQLMPFPGAFVPAAAACGFDVLVTPQAGRPNKARQIQFNNTAITAGPLFVTLKNLSTGKTIDVNISGPIRLSFSGTTTTALFTGPFIQPLPANVATAAGLPLLPLIHGQIVFTFDDHGNVTSIQSVTGTVQDVCQLLQ
jgi:hypothetical protein